MSDLLGPQFKTKKKEKVAYKGGVTKTFTVTKHPSKRTADAVYDQLTEDYPKEALGWVHDIKWRGPINYPTGKIDFNDKHTWRAIHQEDEIKAWKSRIKAAKRNGENVKPGILIERPDKTAMIPDGHHRALAYQELGEPDFAFVGYPSKSKGPWDMLHDYQYRDNTGPDKGGNPGAYHYGRKSDG
jgi:hypothetical protein